MKLSKNILLMTACVLIAGCAKTRSISNSGYQEQQRVAGCAFGRGYVYAPNAYPGELSEFDVLGIARGDRASEAEIQKALAGAKRVQLHPGDSIMLIQSGAAFPDAPMVAELSNNFRVVPFSGVPPASQSQNNGATESVDPESFSTSLRLAAAHGGNDVILCYWGILESENEGMPTKVVSWMPVVNWIVPDEKQHMRIRLKMALIDVRTGDWATLSPEAFDATKISREPKRGAADQKLVESLKEKAYVAGAKELLQRYVVTVAAN